MGRGRTAKQWKAHVVMGNQSKYYGCEVSLYHLLSLALLIPVAFKS